jgi:type IV pilus assembly protein PilV
MFVANRLFQRGMCKPNVYQQGVGLIEVLITVLLLATGLLGIAGMQLRSLKQNDEALLRTQANFLAYDILERVRMASPVAPDALVIPSPGDLTALAEAQLPEGDATIICNNLRLCNVTITWAESVRSNDAKDQQASTFDYSATL